MKFLSVCTSVFICLILFFSIARGQELHDENLKGIVKTVAISFYQSSDTTNRRNLRWTSLQRYNPAGKITAYFHYKKSGRLEYKDTYTYNDKNQLIEDRNEEDGHLSSKTIYSYDNVGGLIHSLTLDQDSLQKYKYTYKNNEKGKVIETSVYNETNNLTTKSIHKLDIKGNDVETRVYEGDKKLVKIWQTQFDSMNNIISSAELSPQGKLAAKKDTHIYTYYPNGDIKSNTSFTGGAITTKQTLDPHGNFVEEIIYMDAGDKNSGTKTLNKYKFDSKGNWIEKSVSENGIPSLIMLRKIEY